MFWSLLKICRKLEVYSTRTDQAWMFRVKCINRLLPTLERKKLYARTHYSEIKCRKCKIETETMEHLTECSLDQVKWKSIEKDVLEKVIREMKESTQEKMSTGLLNGILKWEEENTSQSRARRKRFMRGIITQEIRENLRAEGILRKEATELLAILWNKWIDAFYEEIWKPRCQTTSEWEKKEGLEKKEKSRRKKYKRKTTQKQKQEGKDNQEQRKRILEERKGEEEKLREIGLEEVVK